ncbi:MAG: 50S ribosomal protein L23 [Armatimonadetes bacterium]|nr:50S ribosomal protein L23 [Armatimonadota bacterium]
MKDATEIIIRPVLTEKSVALQTLPAASPRTGERVVRKYSFEVLRGATKVDIRRAVEQLGRCEVEKVNTLTVKGKLRRTRRGAGYTRTWKKAVVTLRSGQELGGVLGQAFEST